jgi:predicted O-linked N-acetylglucosamine transferase (SPINDLY family)
VLDPLYFGGGNSTFEALAVAAPVVTFPGDYMRGRVTFACYKMMGFMDLVARSTDDYVHLAHKVAQDRDFRRHVVEQIRARSGVLFENSQAITETEKFLISAMERTAQPRTPQ